MPTTSITTLLLLMIMHSSMAKYSYAKNVDGGVRLAKCRITRMMTWYAMNAGQTIMTDDLTPPDFLRRDGPRLSQVELDRIIRPKIEWAPIKSMAELNRGEDMTKVNIYADNRSAPVLVFYDGNDTGIPNETLENMDALDRVCTPRHHKVDRLGSNDTETRVAVTFLPGGKPPLVIRPGTTRTERKASSSLKLPLADPPRETPTRAVSGAASTRKNGYLDSRHVTQLVAAGWERIEGATPVQFSKGKIVATFLPPPEGKTWSSRWTLPDGRAGRGIGDLLRALDT